MSALIRNQRRFFNSSYNSTMTIKYGNPLHYRRYLALKSHPQQIVTATTAQALNDCQLQQSPPHNIRNPSPTSRDAAFGFVRWRTGSPFCNYNAFRNFQLGRNLYDNPSSKVEATVQTMKKQQKEKVEEILKEAISGVTPPITETATSSTSAASKATSKAATAPAKTTAASSSTASATAPVAEATATAIPSTKEQDNKPVVVKKSLKTRIWEELVHYYHGFRLLFIDINICRKLLWRVLNGKTLTRRENRLLVRTTSDMFRLIPFSVFIIVPFMELLLPVFIKLFPGMLPSTFQTAKERENKLKQSLQVKLEMAKFLQKTLDEMPVQHKEHKSEEAKQFSNFFQRIKNPNEYVTKDEIIKYASRFEDEITLDSLSREQLAALCRLLELNTMGTSNFLRFQLRVKLRSLAADDRVIAREGVQSLDLYELQQACKARGMRAYGLTTERLHAQLQEWIDLSLNEKVPPTLLLLSRAMLISDDYTTTDKLKETMRVLSDSAAAQTKAAIGELEGKIDNKTKIEVIKEEERKIKEERDEEREEEKAKAEVLMDKAPKVCFDAPTAASTVLRADNGVTPKLSTVHKGDEQICVTAADLADDKTLSSKDVEILSEALKSLSSDKKKMMVEKEQIKEIKEELEDYKEDIEELHEVRNVVKEPVQESRAAQMLFKKVNKMLSQLDKVLEDLEQKQQEMKQHAVPEPTPEEAAAQRRQQEMVHVHELVHAIRKVQQTSTESRLKQIENVLSKLDADKDGVVTVDEVLKVIEAIGRDNVQLNEKQIEDVITLLDKEQLIEAEEKIEKALAKSIKEAEMIKAKKQRTEQRRMAAEQAAILEDLKDAAATLKDNALDLDEADRKANIRSENEQETTSTTNATSSPIAPKAPTPPSPIPTPPPPTTSTSAKNLNSKDKML